MKKIIVIIGLLIVVYSCSTIQNKYNKSITISILPLKYIVEQIVDHDFEVHTLVPPGSSPETYELTPQQIMALSRSEFVFSTGLIDFEQQLTNKINDSGLEVIELSEGIDLITGTCSHDHHNHGVDPHIWTSPTLLKKMSKTAYNAIAAKYPDSTKYTKNYNQFITTLDSLDSTLRNMISDSGVKNFIIYHPALTYYAQDYGIEQIALENEGKEPTAEQLKRIISKARIEGTNKILFQSEFSRATVEAVANDIDAECIEINPLSENVVENLVLMTKIITSR